MLYRLGVTGCGSRVALSEMLRGLADSFATTALQICRKVLGTSRYAVTAVELHLSPPGPKVVVEWSAAGPGICFSTPRLSPNLCLSGAAWGRARSRSWTAGATTLLDEVYAFLSNPSRRQGARAELELDGWCNYLTGRGLRLPSRKFAPPGGVRGAGAGRLVQLPYWTRPTTPPPILPPTSGMARMWRRGGAQLDEEFAFYASLALSPLTSDLAKRFGGGTLSWTGNLFFHASGSRRRLRAWPGRGDGGVCCLGVEFGFRSFTHWPLDGRPRYAR